MLDFSSQTGSGCIAHQIGVRFKVYQPGNSCIASGYMVASHLHCMRSSKISRFHIEERCPFRSAGAYIPEVFENPLIRLCPSGQSLLEVIE